MVFGFPAYHKDHYTAPDTTSNLRKAVIETLDTLSWPLLRGSTTEKFIAKTSISIRSWGEEIVINFLPDNSVIITSKCVWPTQCFDYGKNKINVEKFIMELKNHV